LSELALRIGLLALPARILLLLAGLLAAALLLLAGLLIGVLVRLSRILIWVAHSATPFAFIKLGTTRASEARFSGNTGSGVIIAGQSHVGPVTSEPHPPN
jgi:hypothetical protein